ncbi:lipase family protein [Bradyrhizobium sp. HKCCYLS3077]|uniref:lipase family protein n=1 Tax=Bradyrhizobium sp. HKCCYLS3077 TaxID=3420761 RepID=UPI003EC0C1F5
MSEAVSSPLVPPVSDAVLMTLAGIAYGAPGSIATYLAQDTLTADDWRVVWLAAPPDPPDNFAFIAYSERTKTYAIAIRGTYPNPFSPAYWDDGDEDSPFGDMVEWPAARGAKISAGTSKGLTNLLALTDQAGVTLQDAVGRLPAGSRLAVTGHSLGGTLAPVLALSIVQRSPALDVYVSSFAGMTPGNTAFAALFGSGSPLEGRVRRVYNTLDTVAYGWNAVWATHDFYQPAPKGGPLVAAMLLATAARLELGGYHYAPIGTPVALTGKVQPIVIGCELVAYVIENLHQHMPDTYLSLLGAPPLPFSIVLASVVMPRANPVAATQPLSARPPVVHLA